MTLARVQLAVEGVAAKGARFGPWRETGFAHPQEAARQSAYGAANARFRGTGDRDAYNAQWVVETRDSRGEVRRWQVRTDLQVSVEAVEERERRQPARRPARGTGPEWERVVRCPGNTPGAD